MTSKTQDILQRLDKEVKKDINNKDFLQTRKLLGTYKKVAMYIGDKDMQNQIEEMIQHVHHSFVMHMDLQRPGVYSDKKNSIFIISKTRTPAGNSYFERIERKSNIRFEALRRIKAFCDKQGLLMGNSANLGHNVILRSDQDNGKVKFLFEVRSIESKGQDLTEEIIHMAPKVPIQ
ncbi:MAG: hypothetical protein ACLFP2_05650 [Candidatus Woesearchaeota archaeon]